MAKNDLHVWSGKWITIRKIHGAGSHFADVKKAWGWTGSKWEYLWPRVSAPTTHTITLGGHHVGAHWTFATAKYRGRITHATIIIHARTMWSGTVVGYPSGGNLTGTVHIGSGGGTASRTVSAAKFNGATHGIGFSHVLGTTTAVTRVSLRITYHD